MIINFSRASTFSECEWKSKLRDIDGIVPHFAAEPLVFGGAYHKGSAAFFATGSAEAAGKTAEEHYRTEITGQKFLPEELIQVEFNIKFIRKSLEVFAEQYPKMGYTVLMPEVEFLVPLPDTLHHCAMMHRHIFGSFPPESLTDEFGTSVVCHDPRCMILHYLKGTTDAVIEMDKLIWLLEQKTSAITGDIFYKRWFLDMQPTVYIYGIWKKTGVKPHGFILNVVKKPQKRAADQLAVGFEREPFIRTDADINRAVREISAIATRYEQTLSTNSATHTGAWHGACTKWNRVCYYHDRCKRGDIDFPDEFIQRSPDYVDKAYDEVLNAKT